MKFIFFVMAASCVFFSACSEDSPTEVVNPVVEFTFGSMTDSRDGQIYKTVTIGSQTWMAENLNFGAMFSSCYESEVSNCDKYGRLYTWAVAMDSAGKWSANGSGCSYNLLCSPTGVVRGVCPEGWHLPTGTEWATLFTEVGGSDLAGKMLKSKSGWNNGGSGSDDYQFTALPAGFRSPFGSFKNNGNGAFFWSSSEYDKYAAYRVFLGDEYDEAFLDHNYYKYYEFSVRCVKD